MRNLVKSCLNPCYNGIVMYLSGAGAHDCFWCVLILVIME